MRLITDEKELKKYRLKELLDICIYNEAEVVESVLKDWLANQDNYLNEYRERLDAIGALTQGTVYLNDKTYQLAGFILKRHRMVKEDELVDYLFMPVFASQNCNYAEDPLVFYGCCNLYDDHGFVSNNNGNFIHLDYIIRTKEHVENFVKRTHYEINQAIKSKGIYWNI